ncbi:unnamed protein product [Prorocentrum cordatum]|uniref:Uncharacterized protein n=1 Tax=Prorocentrum cordatum TaxID=2364126 RepID=A0ABN9SU98_9DINO|nr:unnamed protein product [Polarella glacialis]
MLKQYAAVTTGQGTATSKTRRKPIKKDIAQNRAIKLCSLRGVAWTLPEPMSHSFHCSFTPSADVIVNMERYTCDVQGCPQPRRGELWPPKWSCACQSSERPSSSPEVLRSSNNFACSDTLTQKRTLIM